MNAIETLDSDVLVVGDSPCAHKTASNLSALGLAVARTLFTEDESLASDSKGSQPREDTSIPIYFQSHFLASRGGPDNFEVLIDRQGTSHRIKTKQVVVAEDGIRETCFADYGLNPTANVMALSELKTSVLGNSAECIVFVIGLIRENTPFIAKEVMSLAMKLQTTGQHKVYILTRNLKVADNGLEALYRDTRKAGVIYVKFTDTTPLFQQAQDGKAAITFTDEVTREPFQLTPDVLVVDELIQPSRHLDEIANIFKLHTDTWGFIQKDNVHRVGIFTNRRGIYAIGPSRGVVSASMQMADADDASLIISQAIHGAVKRIVPTAEINLNRCVRCLTCLRLCPYEAISLNTRVSIAPQACENCGLCRAECPQQAISLEPFDHTQLMQAARLPADMDTDTAAPHIVAFACARSALPASQMARWMGCDVPPGLKIVQVPCSGGVSIQHILGAFELGADGVLVLTCHTDNCHSEYGNRHAHARVHQMQTLLESIGMEPGRLRVDTLASNMGVAFAEIVKQFEDKLKKGKTS